MTTERPKVIAEIGCNHEGNIEVAREMIRAAAEAGASAVKFQTLRAEDIALPTASCFQELKNDEMNLEQHQILAETAKEAGVEFISTPFSRRAVDLLETVGVKTYKIASMDLTNTDLLKYVARTGKPMMVSTGMAGLSEISRCLEFLTENKASRVSLMHCVSNYPCAAEDLNLSLIPLLKATFNVPVGYSDHFPGTKACLAALMMGAEMVETHFTLDTSRPGADHEHSADPASLKALIRDFQLFDCMRGRPEEMENRADRIHAREYRRGLYAARDLAAGTTITREDLLFCRPEAALTPRHLDQVLGRRTTRAIKAYHEIDWKDF